MTDLEKFWRERLVKGNLDLVVLRLLRSKPRWGYEIVLAIRDKFKVYLSAGTLYPLLHTLEDNGHIQGSWQPDTGRGRRIYRITDSGAEFLSAGEKVAIELAKRVEAEDIG